MDLNRIKQFAVRRAGMNDVAVQKSSDLVGLP